MPEDTYSVLKRFLEAMPEITINRQHPELDEADIAEMTDHEYILFSFGNFLLEEMQNDTTGF